MESFKIFKQPIGGNEVRGMRTSSRAENRTVNSRSGQPVMFITGFVFCPCNKYKRKEPGITRELLFWLVVLKVLLYGLFMDFWQGQQVMVWSTLQKKALYFTTARKQSERGLSVLIFSSMVWFHMC
jgi:hypothetical protein